MNSIMYFRVVLVLAAVMGSAAAAETKLARLPADKLVALAPLLKHADIALIESHPDGKQRQITVMTLVAAPPQVVHDVVGDLENYPKFVRNITKSRVTRNADGSMDQDWVVDLGVASFDGISRNRFLPDGSIDVECIEPNDDSVFLWEFHPTAGGTVLVMYGYTDVWHSNKLILSLVERVATMEHGLALAQQMVQLRSMRQRAEQVAGRQELNPVGKAPGLGFLLDRGTVAIIRSATEGRLEEVSLLDRIHAPVDKINKLLRAPRSYDSFIKVVKKSYEVSRTDDSITYVTEMSLPVVSWETRFAMRWEKNTTDSLGIAGDLNAARYRWDLSPIGAKGTMAVLRVVQDLAATSLVLRTLYQREPLFEHGLSVALGLVYMMGVRSRAELGL